MPSNLSPTEGRIPTVAEVLASCTPLNSTDIHYFLNATGAILRAKSDDLSLYQMIDDSFLVILGDKLYAANPPRTDSK